ncbi:MAG: hypothetical protein ACI358_08160 [Candidatus Limimorpha sp.]
MKTMTAEEFRIYCLLYASNSDFNITRQELIAVGSVVDPEVFIRVYNRYEMDTEAKKKTVIDEHKNLFISCPAEKSDFIESVRRRFFSVSGHDEMESIVLGFLNEIL